MVGIFIFVGVNTICQRDYRLQYHIQYVHGDLYNHLGIDSSTDRMPISNLFVNAYINRACACRLLKMVEFYSPFGIRHVLR